MSPQVIQVSAKSDECLFKKETPPIAACNRNNKHACCSICMTTSEMQLIKTLQPIRHLWQLTHFHLRPEHGCNVRPRGTQGSLHLCLIVCRTCDKDTMECRTKGHLLSDWQRVGYTPDRPSVCASCTQWLLGRVRLHSPLGGRSWGLWNHRGQDGESRNSMTFE